MAEWSKAVDSKSIERLKGAPWVRIPPSPPVIPIRTLVSITTQQKSISRYETGASLPSMKTLVKIAKVLKKPAGYFLDG